MNNRTTNAFFYLKFIVVFSDFKTIASSMDISQLN